MITSLEQRHIDLLLKRYPALEHMQNSIISAYIFMRECYKNNGKLLIAGNGGSAADADHITGELMKKFKIPRPISSELNRRLKEIDHIRGSKLAKTLEKSLMTIPLVACDALTTAFLNDVEDSSIFAQKVLGYGRPDDVFLGISTSGNSENVIMACITAKAIGMKTIGLTGANGGELKKNSDICIMVPEQETYIIQELHQPIYHCWCLMLEEFFFGNRVE